MASSVHQNPSFLKSHRTLIPKPIVPTSIATTSSSFLPVRCGPRSNRGPLVKGRILSIEAIQAVQTLKRVQRTNPKNLPDLISKTISRLIKADLLASLKELLRQDQFVLALQVFSTVRSEYKPDLSLYAELVQALARNEMMEDIDRLILDLESEGGFECDDKGLINLIKGVIGADRRESTVRIYGLMKKSGWGSSIQSDEYVIKVLSNGLRRLGEESLADEIEKDLEKEFARFSRVNLGVHVDKNAKMY
ncbi:Pentatricopeptide repeat-containing protein family [Quillaja saponaria]|uniref:Pentatricopeptide repeat-containing protein family n=1 Tax=Quillaja saponaria TaxID=32244 RepID=A0AAD7LRJ0_QUISA|nr:Pentatricopeptide repeat-containing protein family [Quillaja saponaria]